MTHFQGLSYEDSDHALKAKLFKVVEVPFVLKAGENAGQVLGVVRDFGPEGGFAADEGGGVGEGERVAVVVFGVAQTRDEVGYVAGEIVNITYRERKKSSSRN